MTCNEKVKALRTRHEALLMRKNEPCLTHLCLPQTFMTCVLRSMRTVGYMAFSVQSHIPHRHNAIRHKE